jgi:NodT family efflux transporter outer membrane factor (OMF) lipoprotein
MSLSSDYWRTRVGQRTIARIVACSLFLCLPSCGIPVLCRPEPGPVLPASFDGESYADGTCPENSAHLSIEQFFHDPALLRLVFDGLACNQELKILNQEVEIARNEIMARRGAYFPFVTGGAGAGLRKPSQFTPEGAVEEQIEFEPGKGFPEPLPDFLAGLRFFWELDIWRELRNARDAAIQRSIAAEERRNFFVTRLVAEIAEKYYELLALDTRLEILNQTIALQEQSLKVAEANKAAARGTELAVQRFHAEVFKNQSEKLIVNQEIVQVENHINFLIGRYPQSIERSPGDFVSLSLNPLQVGVPSQLLQNRPDIRQAEREMEAAGLDVQVARARYFPRVGISAGVGLQAFNPKYIFNTPDALIYNVAGDLVAPLINKKAIRAEYLSANAKQLQSVYNYQRVVINAFTEVVNRMRKAENFGRSIEIKKQQLKALDASVDVASKLFQNARVEYVEVLLAQRDLLEARTVLVETKKQQLAAIVNAYQALGGGGTAATSLRSGQPVVCDPPAPPATPPSPMTTSENEH